MIWREGRRKEKIKGKKREGRRGIENRREKRQRKKGGGEGRRWAEEKTGDERKKEKVEQRGEKKRREEGKETTTLALSLNVTNHCQGTLHFISIKTFPLYKNRMAFSTTGLPSN